MTTWLKDDNGNKCSVEYFGSQEAAQKALDSLKNCDNCTNCSRCSGCSDCSRCSGCSDCSGCSRCSGCSDCSRCSGCSDCSGCSGCSGCSDCSRCSGCSDCSGCSGCSRCSDCSRCSNVAWLFDKKDMKGDPDAASGTLGMPPIPVIENIHQRVYEAVSQPNALDMSTWHSPYCNTTHCRAGWVVHLAGEAGYALERFFGEGPLAAQLIYRESGYEINPGKFYVRNDEALADMAKLAGVELEAAE